MTKPDWEAIESAYGAGLMSLREIARQQNIYESAIRNHANSQEASGFFMCKTFDK